MHPMYMARPNLLTNLTKPANAVVFHFTLLAKPAWLVPLLQLHKLMSLIDPIAR